MPKVRFNDKEIPAELIVSEGIDAFSERGRGLMFVEMIADVASDLASPGSEHYDETRTWVKDRANLAAWVQIVDASVHVIPALQNAFLERPTELKIACEYLARSALRTGGSLDRFMRAMGMESAASSSSLEDWSEYGESSETTAYAMV